MLEIGIHKKEQNTLVTLDGQFNALGAIDFDRQMVGMGTENRNIILDFAKVTFLSSAGVRSILKLEQSLRSAKGTLYIAGISYSVRQVLEISGLSRYLKIARDADEAFDLIAQTSQEGFHIETDTCSFRIMLSPGEKGQLVVWDKQYRPASWDAPGDHPLLASTGEFTFALGEGAFVQGDMQDASQRGGFLTIGQFTGHRPHDRALPFDFMISDPNAGAGIYVWDGLSFVGAPNAEINLQARQEVSLGQVIHELFQVIAKTRQHIPEMTGIILEARIVEQRMAPGSKDDGRIVLIGVAAMHQKALIDRGDPGILDYFSSKKWHAAGEDVFFKAIGAVTVTETNTDLSEGSRPIPEIGPHDVTDMDFMEGLRGITMAHGWIYMPAEIIPASSVRLQIVKKDDSYFPDAWEFIARDLYRNNSKLILTPIHGGFSASTFFADSFDGEGRRQLPTVLKIAGKGIIDREEANYHDYVKKYILNNSTSILGTSVFQEWKGLCYSFVGITGPDSTIEWLTKHYKNRPVAELLPLFDKIFTHILKPWYGQPRLEIIHPYRDHDPRITFFPNICRDALEELGISSDDKTLFLPELQREIINPYWFLENVYEQRKNRQKLWYRCIAHRDLNMQNILLDEIGNVYIIDFSETGPGNAISDFARLEPILKIEMSRMNSENDLKLLLEFEQGLLEPEHLDQKPVYRYQGDDPNVRKAFEVICRLRKYADIVTLFEKDIEPYLLAVLEWTYPVVSYKGVDKLQKRYSACSAALICEKLLAISG